MTKTCIVSNCTSCERDNNSGEADDGIYFFKPPKHEKLFEKWQLNIPYTKEPFTKNSFVCQNHFDTNDVVIKYEKTLFQNKWSVLCKTMYLKPKAIPIFFGIESIGNKKKSNPVLQNKKKIKSYNNPVQEEEVEVRCPDVMDEHTYSLPCADENIVQESVDNFGDIKKQDDAGKRQDNAGKRQDDADKIKIKKTILDDDDDDDENGKKVVKKKRTTLPDSLEEEKNEESAETDPGVEYIMEAVLDDDIVPPIPLTYQNLILNLNTMKLPNKLWHTFITPKKDLISFYTIQNDGYMRRVNVYPNLSVRVSIDRVVVPEHYHAELKSMDALVYFLGMVSCWNLCETLKVAKKYVPLGSCEGIAPRFRTCGPIRKKCIACSVRWELDNEEIYQKKQPRKHPERKIMSRRTMNYLDAKISKRREACCEIEEAVLDRIMAKVDDSHRSQIMECIESAKKSDFKKGDNEVHDNLKWAYKCMITRYKGSTVYDTLKEKEKLPLPSRNLLNKYIGIFI